MDMPGMPMNAEGSMPNGAADEVQEGEGSIVTISREQLDAMGKGECKVGDTYDLDAKAVVETSDESGITLRLSDVELEEPEGEPSREYGGGFDEQVAREEG